MVIVLGLEDNFKAVCATRQALKIYKLIISS